MNSKTTLSISEARAKIFDIAKDVQKPGRHYTLTENGRPTVVMMSAEEFESWEETLEVASEFPDLRDRIKDFENDMKTGAYKKYITLEELMESQGYRKKSDAKIHRTSSSRRTKRT